MPPFWGGGAGSPSSTMWPGSRPTYIRNDILIYLSIWPQHICAENCGLCPLRGEIAGYPSNTMWAGRGVPACWVSS